MREATVGLFETIGVLHLKGSGDRRMDGLPPRGQETLVCHLVRERVLERVFEVREEARLIQELCGLEMPEAAAQGVLGLLGDRLQEREWHILSDHGRRLQETLVGGC